jgi:hypothetical protein
MREACVLGKGFVTGCDTGPWFAPIEGEQEVEGTIVILGRVIQGLGAIDDAIKGEEFEGWGAVGKEIQERSGPGTAQTVFILGR